MTIENEGKKSSKEMWLFLIFLDIIALGVLGFFIYTSFFSGLNTPMQDDRKPILEEVVVAEIKLPAAEPEAKPQPKPVVAPEEKPKPAAPAPVVAAPVEKPSVQAAEKKQSVFVSGTGATRKVTFKYYGDGKQVAVIGGFTMRRPVAMKKTGNEWATTLVIYPGEYKYMYVVDGKEIADPNAKTEDGKSVLIVK